ncbi:MAG TPA: hypothetical protein VJT67_03185 [Longimicrobiaceae bacterium]|nr:hypothetical protein [Longimicrobiaceae bacterium]
MATKYWRVKVKGEPSVDDIHRAVGQSGGQVLRIHHEKGETHVYYAGEGGAEAHGLEGGGRATSVKLADVSKV